jgi:hypothetical protein
MAGLSQQQIVQNARSSHDLSEEKRQHIGDDEDSDEHHNGHIPHSLAALPAGLEVALPYPSDKEVYIEEKQPVHAYKENCQISNDGSSEKQVCETPVAPDGWHAPWKGRSMPARICGMRAKVFWILLASAVIVFGLGIGIGMGTSKLNGEW